MVQPFEQSEGVNAIFESWLSILYQKQRKVYPWKKNRSFNSSAKWHWHSRLLSETDIKKWEIRILTNLKEIDKNLAIQRLILAAALCWLTLTRATKLKSRKDISISKWSDLLTTSNCSPHLQLSGNISSKVIEELDF